MAEKEYARLGKESQLQTIPVTQTKEDTFIVTLNTCSLKKRLDDILSDKHLLCNDIIGLTETQSEVRDNTAELKVKIKKHFWAHFNCNSQKQGRIGVVYSNKIQSVDSENHDSMTIFNLSKI